MNHTNRHIAAAMLLLALLFAWPINSSAQATDSLKTVQTDSTQRDTSHKEPWFKSPSGIAFRSAIIPGWGQISNRQALKVPFIYAGLATSVYFIHTNNQLFQRLRTAYKYRTDSDPATIDEFDTSKLNVHPAKEGRISSSQSLLDLREQYRRYRDLSIIITAGVYAANILDAYVYAHLKDFDVSENLALSVKPVNFTNIAGVNYTVATIQLKLK